MKLIINYISTLVYQLMVVLLPIVTLPYLTRIFLPHNLGINSLIMALSSYFLLFAVFGLAVHGQKEVAYWSHDPHQLAERFWEIETLSVIMTLLSFAGYLTTLFIMPQYQIYILATAPMVLANLLDISWLFIGLQRVPTVMTRNFIVKVLTVIAIFTLVKNNDDLLVLMIINSASSIISNATLWFIIPKELKWVPVQWKKLKHHFVMGSLLFLPAVSTAVYTILSRVILNIFGTVNDVAYFDNADKIIRTLLTIITSATLTIMPEIAKLFSKHLTSDIFSLLRKVLLLSLAFVIPAAMGMSLISREFSIVFFGLPYQKTGVVMQIEGCIMIPVAIANIIANQFLVPLNKNKSRTFVAVTGAVINILVSLPLVMKYGAIGSAYAILITEVAVAIMYVALMGKDFKRIVNGKEIFKVVVASLFMSGAIFFAKQYSHSIGHFWEIIIVVIFAVTTYILMLFLLKSEIIIKFLKK